MYSEIFTAKRKTGFGNVTFRQATINDLEFVIEAIIESEKSGSQTISTCNVFGFTEERYKEILREILVEEIYNYEYELTGFLIAEKEGKYVGTSGSWIEGLEDISSGVLKTSILIPYLDHNNVDEMEKNLHLIDALAIQRETGAFQLEHIYVRKDFRGLGLCPALIKENIKRSLLHYPFKKVQTILFKDNVVSFCAHLKLGFEIVQIKTSEIKDIQKCYPYNSKVLMELSNEKLLHIVS